MSQDDNLVKSKQRVADHGEVFTPSWMVNDMLDLVKDESERIDARVLEPACGEGAFLQEVLRRKLTTCQARYGKNEFERRHYGLLGLMCTYGIELLEDNAQICRDNLHAIFVDFLGPDAEPEVGTSSPGNPRDQHRPSGRTHDEAAERRADYLRRVGVPR